MNDRILASFERSLGQSFLTGDGIPERFCYDESTTVQGRPDAVFIPDDEEHLRGCIALAAEHRIPVIARGAGTGVCGGCVATDGGIVLSLEKMSTIGLFDETNASITVGAGVVNGALKDRLARLGWWYAPDPQSWETSTIGGNIATNAGGPQAIRYGVTRQYVMALRFVDGTGTLVSAGAAVHKASSGYSLCDLLCGSEGTLGVVIEATVRCVPRPLPEMTVAIPFRTPEDAVAFFTTASTLPLAFSSIEFVDETAKRYVEQFLGRRLPCSGDARCYLYLRYDAQPDASCLEEAVEKNNGLDIVGGMDATQAARLWEGRRAVSEAFRAAARKIYKADVVVPRSRIAELVRRAEKLSGDLPVACFGHIGDGNVHVNVLDLEGDREQDARGVMDALMREVRALGGLPSGEHGIGVAKKRYVGSFFGTGQVRLWHGIKQAFDPHGIMNPGKIFEDRG